MYSPNIPQITEHDQEIHLFFGGLHRNHQVVWIVAIRQKSFSGNAYPTHGIIYQERVQEEEASTKGIQKLQNDIQAPEKQPRPNPHILILLRGLKDVSYLKYHVPIMIY